ncbi:hypothetical protein FRB90_000605 [Tulasnella sp. 427]|nr:hypothetical protein FRB90_000605 [Tulasnella sp. 427]
MGIFEEIGKEFDRLGNNLADPMNLPNNLLEQVKDNFGTDGKVTKAVEHIPGYGYTLAAVHTISGDDEAAKRAFDSSNDTIKGAVDIAKSAVENFGIPPP